MARLAGFGGSCKAVEIEVRRKAMTERVFEGFDFSALDLASFKEDAVREELIAPLLRTLGYGPTGDIRVERSKNLVHPFVLIGTRRHRVSIVPDYTLWYGEKPLLVIDAKAPKEELLRSRHAEQAYSYAIHPEVRCPQYALCSGRQLVVYETARLEPIFVAPLADFRWKDAVKYLGPAFLRKPILREFFPDLGIHIHKLGQPFGSEITFRPAAIGYLARVSDSLFSANAGLRFEDQDYMATFDFGREVLDAILGALPSELLHCAERALSRSPFGVSIGRLLKVDCLTRLGKLTKGEHDYFIPFEVTSVLAADFRDDEWVEVPDGMPDHVECLVRTLRRQGQVDR
jgi:hypothetical protein